jgi:hypothetical protein
MKEVYLSMRMYAFAIATVGGALSGPLCRTTGRLRPIAIGAVEALRSIVSNSSLRSASRVRTPDWADLARELKRPGEVNVVNSDSIRPGIPI